LASNGLAVYDSSSGRFVRLLGVHEGLVTSLLVCGGRVVSAGDDGTIRIWDIATGSILHTLTGHDGEVNSVAATPDGLSLVSVGSDGTIRLWNLATGSRVRTIGPVGGALMAVACGPDGRSVISGGRDGVIRVWDLETGTERCAHAGHTRGVTCLVVTPDGRQIVSGGRDAAVRMWDLGPGTIGSGRAAQSGDALRAHEAAVVDLAVTPDGTRLASCALTEIACWDLEEGRELCRLRHEPWSCAVAWMPDGRSVVSAGHDRTLRIWDAVRGTSEMTLTGHESEVLRVAVTSSPARIASGADDGAIRVWDAVTRAMLPAPQGLGHPIIGLAAFPNGQCLAAVSSSVLVILDLWSGTGVERFENLLQVDFSAVAVSPDGLHLATAGRDREHRRRGHDEVVTVWDVDPLRPTAFLWGHTDTVNDVAWMSNGRHIVSASEDGTIAVWDAASGARLTCWVIGTACHAVVTVDRWIAAGDRLGRIHRFELRENQRRLRPV
jgi:WD40 repeat protein